MRAIEEVTTEETATLLGIRQQTVKNEAAPGATHVASGPWRAHWGSSKMRFRSTNALRPPGQKSAGATWLRICEIGVAMNPLR
jgi:hypothetical protein